MLIIGLYLVGKKILMYFKKNGINIGIGGTLFNSINRDELIVAQKSINGKIVPINQVISEKKSKSKLLGLINRGGKFYLN